MADRTQGRHCCSDDTRNGRSVESRRQRSWHWLADSSTGAKRPVPSGERRLDSIRFRLASLAVACVLPLWIVAGLLIFHNYQGRRALTEQRMLETTRALSMAVDREFTSMEACLNALAATPALVSGDLPAFYRQAQTVSGTGALREAICDYLRSLGYTVFAASSGKDALSAASQHEGNIDLLITDLVMPGMSGQELAQRLQSLRPDMKTICMSGYSDDVASRQDIHEIGAAFLHKPFNLGALACEVRNALGKTDTVQ